MIWHRRSLLIFLAGLLFGLAVVRMFCWQGVVAPIHIASGSMVPALRGAHYAVVCQDCEFSFPCDATSTPETGQAVCPNCGFPGNPLTPEQLRSGQRVVIDRLPYLLRMPRRWDLVAFLDPLEPTHKSVKRVVGLPGERIAIREGDLFIDGQIARKPMQVQRSMAVLVHDDAYRPARTHDLPRRWESVRERSGWKRRAAGYQFSPRDDAGRIDWLTYRSWRCFASPLARSEETPVLDHYGYNQNTSRELHAVADLTLSCRVHWKTSNKLWMRVRSRRDVFEVELDRWRQTATLRRDDVVIGRYYCGQADACDFEFGICDRQVFLTANRRLVCREAFEPADQPSQPTASPVAVGAQQGEVRIEELKIYRDIYYLEPHRRALDWTKQTLDSGGEILVLGDNVPISRDSRNWPTAGLSHKSLIGRVLMPF